MRSRRTTGAGRSAADAAEPGSIRHGADLTAEVVHDAGDWSDIPDAERRVVEAAAALARNPSVRLRHPLVACVALSDDASVSRLNGTYRGKPKPTNVLSFAAPAGAMSADGETRFLGDVILAQETIDAEAAEQGIPIAHHVQHLVVHGLLHLLGFDHQTEDQARTMELIESETLATLDIPDPYGQT